MLRCESVDVSYSGQNHYFRKTKPNLRVNKLVFVVEDNPAQQKMLQIHFEEMLGNYGVKTFTDPEEMLNHLSDKPFAIVLDHFFPGTKTGLNYLSILKKKLRSVPVIYYTASEDAKIRAEALKLGAEEFISKDAASLVRLRTALDTINERQGKKKGFFSRLFGK